MWYYVASLINQQEIFDPKKSYEIIQKLIIFNLFAPLKTRFLKVLEILTLILDKNLPPWNRNSLKKGGNYIIA